MIPVRERAVSAVRGMLLAAAACVLSVSGLAGCGPKAPRQPSAQPNVTVLPEPLPMPGLNRSRTLRLYLPPSYATQADRRYPVIYMHDGQNLYDDATSYAGEWGVDETMNELARTRGFEAIVVGIDNGGERRMAELSPVPNKETGTAEGPQYTRFVVDVVKPWIDQHYRTRPERASTAIIGSSMGGLISHYAVDEFPAVFSKAGVFSPSYWAAPQMIADAARRPLPADLRVYLYAGGREGGGMEDDARRMYAALGGAAAADRLSLHVAPAAEHNEAAWRPEFERAVVWLFQLDSAGKPDP